MNNEFKTLKDNTYVFIIFIISVTIILGISQCMSNCNLNRLISRFNSESELRQSKIDSMSLEIDKMHAEQLYVIDSLFNIIESKKYYELVYNYGKVGKSHRKFDKYGKLVDMYYYEYGYTTYGHYMVFQNEEGTLTEVRVPQNVWNIYYNVEYARIELTGRVSKPPY